MNYFVYILCETAKLKIISRELSYFMRHSIYFCDKLELGGVQNHKYMKKKILGFLLIKYFFSSE